MKQRPRIYYSDAQKALMWDRGQKGESMNAIGQGRDNYHATGGAIMAEFRRVLDCNAHLGFVSRAYKLPPDNDAGPQDKGVMTFTNCSMKEGATYDMHVEGLLACANTLGAHANHASLGADLKLIGNGGLWRKKMELVGDQIDCDVSRVYDAKLRRVAKVR